MEAGLYSLCHLMRLSEAHCGVCVSLNPFTHTQQSASLLKDGNEVFQLRDWESELPVWHLL